MVHIYLTQDRAQENIKIMNVISDKINLNARLVDEIAKEIDAVEEVRRIHLKELELIDEKLKILISRKDYLSLSDLKIKMEEMKRVVDNTKIIEVIVVDEEKFELSNGLVDLNRDMVMKLVKTIEDEKKIRILIGMMGLFFIWSKHRVFFWARRNRGHVWSSTFISKGISLSDERKTAKVVGEKGGHAVMIDGKILSGVGVLSVKIVSKPFHYGYYIGVVAEIPKDFTAELPIVSIHGDSLRWMLSDCRLGYGVISSSGYTSGDIVTVRVNVDRGDVGFFVNGKRCAELAGMDGIKRGVYFAAQLYNTDAEWTIIPSRHEKD